jgi:Ser/Thr protein kinase RdoA (MazF antagonist)
MTDENAVASIMEEKFNMSSFGCERIRDGVNTVFLVSKSDNPVYIVKFGTANPELVAREGRIIKRLRSSDVPVPEIYGYGVENSIPYLVSEFVDGKQLDYATDMAFSEVSIVARDMGRVLAKMHSMEFPQGKLGFSGDAVVSEAKTPWGVFFREFLSNQALDAQKNFPELAKDARSVVHWAEIPNTSPNYLCPIDFHSKNVIWKNHNVESVIDFERCYGGIREWGYCVTRYMLAMGRDEDTRKRILGSFDSGYTEVSGVRVEPSPVVKLSAIIREMRAAHIWWDDYTERRDVLSDKISDIKNQIRDRN